MILQKIVKRIREDLPGRKKEFPNGFGNLEPSKKDFELALSGKDPVAVIAEVKRASPSKGLFNLPCSPVELASRYCGAGASAISVITEKNFFLGRIDDLKSISASVNIPVLRKDFIVDEFQILEARHYGADAILLIAAVLDVKQLRDFADCAAGLGMGVLVEVHNDEELDRVLETNARVVGINNRDLRDFSVTLETTKRLSARIPSDRLIVSESGIFTNTDVNFVKQAGANAVLVGESLVTSNDPAVKLKQLLGRE